MKGRNILGNVESGPKYLCFFFPHAFSLIFGAVLRIVYVAISSSTSQVFCYNVYLTQIRTLLHKCF